MVFVSCFVIRYRELFRQLLDEAIRDGCGCLLSVLNKKRKEAENDARGLREDHTDTSVGWPSAVLSVLSPSIGPLYKCVSHRGLLSDLSPVALSYRAMAHCQDFAHSRRPRWASIKSRRIAHRRSMAHSATARDVQHLFPLVNQFDGKIETFQCLCQHTQIQNAADFA